MIAKELLKGCEPFSSLTDAELEKMAGLAIERSYEAGTTIFKSGSNADELLILREGRVALQMTLPKADGQSSHRITVDVVNKNEVLGWAAVVEPYKYAFTAVSLQEIDAISISAYKLRALLSDDPKTGYHILNGLIRVVASRLYDTMRLLVSERQLTPAP